MQRRMVWYWTIVSSHWMNWKDGFCLNFKHHNDLIAQKKLLDYITIYIGETFRKYIGGKWYIDLENKKNVFYSMPVLTDKTYRGLLYVSPMTYATACISRNKGNYISTILLNCMKDMGIAETK